MIETTTTRTCDHCGESHTGTSHREKACALSRFAFNTVVFCIKGMDVEKPLGPGPLRGLRPAFVQAHWCKKCCIKFGLLKIGQTDEDGVTRFGKTPSLSDLARALVSDMPVNKESPDAT